jgi:hypothetical protein
VGWQLTTAAKTLVVVTEEVAAARLTTVVLVVLWVQISPLLWSKAFKWNGYLQRQTETLWI